MKKMILSIATMLCLITAQAQNITFNSPALYPEGTAYSAKHHSFYVGSVHLGQIGKLDEKGNYTVFTNDDALVTSVGIQADDKRNVLYVAIADNGYSTRSTTATANKLSKLAAYDLTTGKRRFIVDLGTLTPDGSNFANDLALDALGNIYVTNSYSPVIYKVTQAGKASVFVRNDAWQGKGFNLNGIVYSPDGFLIVAQSNTGDFFKISLKGEVHKIEGLNIPGADGLVLNGKDELAVFSHVSYNASLVKTTAAWDKAAIVKTEPAVSTFPTTGVRVNGKYYMLNAKLDVFFTPNATPVNEFVLQELKF